ncbi:MAG: hypothetical protein ACMXYF_05805, partial [Candidatus Woesearchaeota archaeon]
SPEGLESCQFVCPVGYEYLDGSCVVMGVQLLDSFHEYAEATLNGSVYSSYWFGNYTVPAELDASIYHTSLDREFQNITLDATEGFWFRDSKLNIWVHINKSLYNETTKLLFVTSNTSNTDWAYFYYDVHGSSVEKDDKVQEQGSSSTSSGTRGPGNIGEVRIVDRSVTDLESPSPLQEPTSDDTSPDRDDAADVPPEDFTDDITDGDDSSARMDVQSSNLVKTTIYSIIGLLALIFLVGGGFLLYSKKERESGKNT